MTEGQTKYEMVEKPENSMEAPVDEAQEDGEQLLRGTVNRITYRNPENGFGVLRVQTGTKTSLFSPEETTTLVGEIPSTLSVGMNFIARGIWQTHAKFGKQFRARSITEAAPSGRDAIQRYLGSGAVKGFGPVLAERIVETFGEDALSILDNEPHRLIEVPGIGAKKVEEISEAWGQKKNLREILLFFQNHNVPLGLAQRLYNTYGNQTIETVTKNPFVLARDIWGIGFQTADQIALALGLAPDSPERLAAGLLHTMKKAAEDGHCFLPRDTLLAKAASLLDFADETVFNPPLEECMLLGDLLGRGENIYLPVLNTAESDVTACIVERLCNLSSLKVHIPSSVLEAEGEYSASGFTLSPQQLDAVRLSARNNLLVITGGPGCGKTTVVKTISNMFRRAGLSVRLAAPTGRAAQRLAEVCDAKASTIHRLLKYDPQTRSFLHDKSLPLPADALIVDESSMIDIPLAASLLQALSPDTRLILVGDADQLPSVGPGLFLSDLLGIPELPRVRLDTLFRRDETSRITQIAHQINSGIVPEIPEPDGHVKSDAYFLPVNSAEEGAALLERLVIEQLPKRFGFKRNEITVLTPMNRGELGVGLLNKRLQSQLTPPIPGGPSVKVGQMELRLGDRVCQRVNNYQLTQGGVFNGDQGEIVSIDVQSRSLQVRLWDDRVVEYPSEAIHQLDLAYALTIHRSQGSEMPAVVVALHDSHTILLERQLLYTAVTRAKKVLVIVGTRRALETATRRSRSKRRFTAVGERVTESLLSP